MNNEIEIWKDVIGYEDYQVSSFGRVKSIKYGKERIMKFSENTTVYLQLGLSVNGNRNCLQVHVLVAMAFHGHKPCGYELVVDHIDNDKSNNRADNLQLIPARENTSKDRKGGASKFIGVFWSKDRNKWIASIYFEGRLIHLGYFDDELDAKNAYQKARLEVEQGLDLNIIYPKRVETSKFKGVYWIKSSGKWRATYKGKHIGYYDTELEAHQAVQKYIASLNLKT